MGVPCPKCGQQCVRGAQFCHRCGTSLLGQPQADAGSDAPAATDPAVADALRRLMPTSYIERLMASRGRVEGERRIVTMLFSDIQGSTAMAEKLDPEEVLNIMNGAFEVLISPVTRYEGTIARLMGDAILAFFGAPIAHEDDPRRACFAALEIIEGVRRYAAELERTRGIQGFNVRVGMHTGLVVVAEVGSDLRVEYTAMGDAVNLAARMEAAAEPGTVLMTETTWKRICREFVAEPLPPITVKGKSKPVNVYRLLHPRAAETGGHFDAGVHAPLVGRGHELRALRDAVKAVRAGNGGRIAVVGDAGLGKSRLIEEARRLTCRTVEWAGCRGSPYTSGAGYWTARTLLCALAGVGMDASPERAREALRSELKRNGACHVEECCADLSSLFGLPLRAAAQARTAGVSPKELRRRGFAAFGELLALKARHKPLVLVCEDLHAADASSLELIESTFPLSRTCPLLFLLAYRTEEGPMREVHTRWFTSAETTATVLALAPLTRPESAELLHHLLQDKSVAPELQHRILEKAEGNPMYLEEVFQWLMDAGLLECGGAAAAASDLQVPDALHAMIMARIDRLALEDRQTLQTASVIGRTFPRTALAELMGTSSVETSLAELQSRQFLHRRGAAAQALATGGDELAFRQNLTQEVAYNSLLVSQRKMLHKRSGEIIESLFPDLREDLSAVLATHFEKGEVHEKALRYLVSAARRAATVYANQEAIGYYLRALAIAEAHPLLGAECPGLHESLGDIYALISRYTLAADRYRRALEAGHPRRVVLHRKLAQVYGRQGLYSEALQCCLEAHAELKCELDAVELARVQTALGMTYYNLNETEKALEVSLIALEIMESCADMRGIAEACNILGLIHAKQGNMEKALAYHRKALPLWKKVGERSGLAAAHNNLGSDYALGGDWNNGIKHYRRSLALCKLTGNRHGLAKTYDNLGQLYARRGLQDQAWHYMKKAAQLMGEISAESTDVSPEMWQQWGTW